MTTTDATRAAVLAIARAELAEAEFCLRSLPQGVPTWMWDAAIDLVLATRDEVARLEREQ